MLLVELQHLKYSVKSLSIITILFKAHSVLQQSKKTKNSYDSILVVNDGQQ